MSGVQALRPGDVVEIAGYKLLGRLGQGGMGTVFLAESTTGQKVALKVIQDHLLDQPEFRARFSGEVERAKNVPPFCTAEVLDADPEHEPPYLVVEYVDGPTLSEIVRESGPVSGAALHSLGIGMATALTAIHNSGVIHRDLKPANVLLPRGGVKVIDFGLARTSTDGTQLTQTDQVMGTIPYIAPERLGPTDRPISPAADVFAWGAVMVYAATGHTPFGGDTPAATAVRILSEEPNLDGVGAALRDVVAQTLQKDPAARPTARELLDRLVSLGATSHVSKDVLRPAAAAQAMEPTSLGLLGDGEDTGPMVVSTRRRRSLVLVAGLASVALLAAGGVFFSSYLLKKTDANANTPSTPTPSPSAVVSVADSPLPTVSPTADPLPQLKAPLGWYEIIPPSALTAPQYWQESTACKFSSEGYTAATNTGVAQCHINPPRDARDVAVGVRLTLGTPKTCAALWFRFSPKTGGYAIRLCPDSVTLYDYRPPAKPGGKWTSVKVNDWPQPAGTSLAVNVPINVEMVVDADRVSLTLNGRPQGARPLSQLDSGSVAMGIYQLGTAKSAYSVMFTDFTLWEGPTVTTSPSQSVSPSSSPSPKVSKSPSRSPSAGPTVTP
ncbi:serine/threonine protein kinase [Hamadaea flava]|uniref:Serine/threonine protein kinase n=1 Tax=Hamadaea flava TaxID=1742688 RepID=A0ABV8M211_9ACTN|nr:serine/threonine-protein kinase [Hamadaea flava]MCP2326751.1 serine/threonine protein kinase [Hamadaea flava]